MQMFWAFVRCTPIGRLYPVKHLVNLQYDLFKIPHLRKMSNHACIYGCGGYRNSIEVDILVKTAKKINHSKFRGLTIPDVEFISDRCGCTGLPCRLHSSFCYFWTIWKCDLVRNWNLAICGKHRNWQNSDGRFLPTVENRAAMFLDLFRCILKFLPLVVPPSTKSGCDSNEKKQGTQAEAKPPTMFWAIGQLASPWLVKRSCITVAMTQIEQKT